MKRLLFYLLLIVIQFFLLSAESSQTYVGDFSSGGDESVWGGLARRPVFGGNATWQLDGVLHFVGSDSVGPGEEKSANAWIALPGVAERVVVRATINPRGTDWTGLALGGRWGSSFYDTAQLWILLKPTGDYQVRAKGTKLILKSGRLDSLPSEGVEVEIAYARGDNSIEAFISGQSVLASYSLHGDNFSPICDSVGFRFNGPIEEGAPASVSGFSVDFEIPATYTVALDDPLCVYAPGVEISASLRGTFIGSPRIGWTAELVDFSGARIWEKKGEASVSDGYFEQVVVVPAPSSKGYMELRTAFFAEEGKEPVCLVRPVAIIPEVPEKGFDVRNPFGAMVFPHIDYPWKDRELDARYMKRAGMQFVRTHRLNWRNAQPFAGSPFNWTELDREVEIYSKQGLRIIATVAWPTPAWASQGNGHGSPADVGNFLPTLEAMPSAVEFHRELAARYRRKIDLFEIGNEVDAYFWLGSLKNYLAHDAVGIMRDYYEYFSLLANAIRSSDTEALIAPGTTGAVPEGHAYRPWLKTMLDFGLGEKMSAFSTHYNADLVGINELLRANGGEKPVFFTEIGGISRGKSDESAASSGVRTIIRGDYYEMTRQLRFSNVRAVCKFILREQPTYGGEGHLSAGLLTNDFEIRPSYPAYATLVRTLAGAKFFKELNITRDSDRGWLEGFCFEKKGSLLTLLFLHGADSAEVHLRSDEQFLTLTDVMGNKSRLETRDGVVNFEIDDLPVIIEGRIVETAGEPFQPKDQLLDEIEIPLKNPGFEVSPSDLAGWSLMTDEMSDHVSSSSKFSVSIDQGKAFSGQQSARLSAVEKTRWYGISQDLPMDRIPVPKVGEYLIVRVRAQVRGENILGKGVGYTLAFRDKSRHRIGFVGSPYFGFGDSFEWKPLEGEHKIDKWLPETDGMSLDLLLGLSTGNAWIDDVHVVIQHWKSGEFSSPDESVQKSLE